MTIAPGGRGRSFLTPPPPLSPPVGWRPPWGGIALAKQKSAILHETAEDEVSSGEKELRAAAGFSKQRRVLVAVVLAPAYHWKRFAPKILFDKIHTSCAIHISRTCMVLSRYYMCALL